MDLLCFEHGGVMCAVPRAQVLQAATEPGDRQSSLWDPLSAGDADRWLAAHGDGGVLVWVGCSKPVLRTLPSSAARPLSPALRAMLAPHVVGWAMIDDDLLWLVDFTRLRVAVDQVGSPDQ